MIFFTTRDWWVETGVPGGKPPESVIEGGQSMPDSFWGILFQVNQIDIEPLVNHAYVKLSLHHMEQSLELGSHMVYVVKT